MARINIEDSIWADFRYRQLERKLGQFVAIGSLTILYKTAQAFWTELDKESGRCKKGGIPAKVFKIEEFPDELIDVGLVEIVENHYFVKGSENSFGWLVQKKEAGATGGRPNKINNMTKPEHDFAKPEHDFASEPHNPPSPSLSLSLNTKNNETNPSGFGEVENIFGNEEPKKEIAIKPPKGGLAIASQENKNPDVGKFLACYVAAFRSRYSTRPDLSGKRLGQVKSLVKGAESQHELCELIQVYCQSNDEWFCKKMHDVQTFAENLGKVRVMMINGLDSKHISQKQEIDSLMKLKLD